ncbi:hypothetical protein E4U21_002372 [Claviceps maximensis]|nr:hypothetical protein E4U21_002372 [Claviceps maximensis]
MRLSLFVAAVTTLTGSSVNARYLSKDLGFLPLPIPVPPRPPVPDNIAFDFDDELTDYKARQNSSRPRIRGATFRQLIDHNNPSLGTFNQSYWYNAEFWAGPGSPIVLNAPGEFAANGFTGYTTNRTLPGVFAQTVGGATLLLEHRYWGDSSPYQNLTSETLQYLTLDQAIQDIVYFAKNVRLPFDPSGASKPDKAPWVLSGGSYPGALTAWVHDFAPGTFWAYHATSAPVETIGDFWQYFEPVNLATPKNCSADFKRINAHFQEVLTTGNAAAKYHLKSKFGLGVLADDDFLSATTTALSAWQEQQFFTGYSDFYQLCDWIEGFTPGSNKTVRPGPNGVGLFKSLENYASYWTKYILAPDGPAICDDGTLECWNTHNATSEMYTDTSVPGGMRQWMWMLCNEAFEYWQVGSPQSPIGYPPPLYTSEYYRRQCSLFFPEVNGHKVGMNKGVRAINVDRRTGGWYNTNTTRLMWVNGETDPWRSASVASDFRPGGPFVGDKDHPSWVVPKGSHCSDLLIKNAKVNEGVKRVVDAEVKKMKEWVGDFYKQKKTG